MASDAQRKAELAYRLHLAGATWVETAQSKDPVTGKPLYRSPGAASQAVKTWRRDNDLVEREEVDDELQEHLKRLDRLHRAIWPQALSGDVAAARECRMITVAKANLQGYGKGVQPKPKIEEKDPIDQLAEKRAARRAQ